MLRLSAGLLMLAVVSSVGCTSQQCRPCGPGYLGNILVPQGFLGADFHDACYGHDACYATPGSDRLCCDQQFHQDMVDACECSSHPVLCRLRAKQWYWQVRAHGRRSFRVAQREGAACACCDCNSAEEVVSDAAPQQQQ